ncbi:MAG: protoheme IX farnesyltransferase [Phycisphaerales bacterium]|nr:MAG: protoheme IX farnesyltransferase [Phycisphaerales bacterium]
MTTVRSTPTPDPIALDATASTADAVQAAALATSRQQRGWLGIYLDLTKARLSALVLLTTAVGFIVAMPVGIDWALLLWTILGTGLAAGSAAAYNQVWEVPRDRRMVRTQSRPLVAGRMSSVHAFIAATLMGYLGVMTLAVFVNFAAAGLALLTILLYVLIYTPLKAHSTLNTLVGAVCGAIPPMIGWVAARGAIEPGAWILGLMLFVWQLPHFLALAWLYRDDYERGGFIMLPMRDRDGELTAQVTVLTAVLLIPICLIGTLLGVAGLWYAFGSLLLGLWLVALSVRFYRNRTNANARRVFFASIVYLPILLILLMLDRGPINSGGFLSNEAVPAGTSATATQTALRESSAPRSANLLP